MEFSLFPVTYQQIIVFLTVAEEGGFAKAASRLHITQSAISKNIAKLENILELQLFSRTTRDVSLTDTGRRLYDAWGPLFEDFGRSYKLALSIQKEADSQLKIGLVNATHPRKYLDNILNRFRDDHPETHVIMKALNIQRLESYFINGYFDIAMLPDFERFWAIDNGYSYKWIARSNATVVMSAKHPLASKSALTTEDILDYVFSIPNYLSNNSYSLDLRERFSPYKKIPKTVSVFESAHDAQLLFSHNNSELMFLDSFFEFPEYEGVLRKPVTDQQNGLICVWNPQRVTPALKQFFRIYDDVGAFTPQSE